MKTLLVIPKYYDTESGGRFYEMPLGIAYINAALCCQRTVYRNRCNASLAKIPLLNSILMPQYLAAI